MVVQTVENLLQCRRPRFDPWVRKMPWRRECQPTPVFLPGESHGQRSLVGYSPWGCKESDMTELLSTYIMLEFLLWIKVRLSLYCLLEGVHGVAQSRTQLSD